MPVFEYRVRGRDSIELAAHPRAGNPGPWLEIEAPSFADARRELAELSSATGFVYEARDPDDDPDDGGER